MLGFMGGFGYLGGVEEGLDRRRGCEARVKIEGGCVGIGNNERGLYGMECGGGWEIIGGRGVKVFDLNGSGM
ncbi:carboxyltransferase domain-containing protein, partial [Staphylococcus capitis]|uniref:carboxyltransferase domain-containing protein n=1 Tax=Staphylococcus capitis TaxID=29388 RepID=UPI00370956D2